MPQTVVCPGTVCGLRDDRVTALLGKGADVGGRVRIVRDDFDFSAGPRGLQSLLDS